jgi:hypothetical protein
MKGLDLVLASVELLVEDRATLVDRVGLLLRTLDDFLLALGKIRFDGPLHGFPGVPLEGERSLVGPRSLERLSDFVALLPPGRLLGLEPLACLGKLRDKLDTALGMLRFLPLDPGVPLGNFGQLALQLAALLVELRACLAELAFGFRLASLGLGAAVVQCALGCLQLGRDAIELLGTLRDRLALQRDLRLLAFQLRALTCNLLALGSRACRDLIAIRREPGLLCVELMPTRCQLLPLGAKL